MRISLVLPHCTPGGGFAGLDRRDGMNGGDGEAS